MSRKQAGASREVGSRQMQAKQGGRETERQGSRRARAGEQASGQARIHTNAAKILRFLTSWLIFVVD